MPLHAFNLTVNPVTVPAINPPFVLPASNMAGRRGPTVNLTAEMTPDLTVDPVYGMDGGLLAADYATIQVLVAAGTIEFEWVISEDYDTATLDVASNFITPAVVPAPSSVPKSDGSGYIASGWTSVQKTLTVGKGGSVDFNSVKDACDYVASMGDATVSSPYMVVVYPGEYVEDPFSIPSFVSISGIGSARRQRIVASNAAANFISPLGDCGIYDVTLIGPSGAGFATVYCDVGGSVVNIRNVGFGNGYYSVHVCPVAATTTVNIRYCFQLGAAVVSENFVRCTGFGYISTDGIFLKSIPTTTDYYIVGPNARADIANGSSAANVGAFIDDSANVTISGINFLGGDKAIWVGSSGATNLTVNASYSPPFSYTNDLKVDSVAAIIRYSGGSWDYTTGDLIPGTNIQAMFTNNGSLDGGVVWGELLSGDENGLVQFTSYARDSFFTGLVTGGDVSRNIAGGLKVDIDAGRGYLFTGGIPVKREWLSSLGYDLDDDSTNWVYIDSSGAIGHSTTEPSYDDKIRLAIAYTAGGEIVLLTDYKLPIPHLRRQLHEYHENVVGPISVSGNIATVHAPGPSLKIDVDQGTFFIIDYEEETDTVSPIIFNYWYRDGSGGWSHQLAQTDINVLKFDDGTGTLDNLTAGKFRRDLLFVTGSQEFHVVFGQEEHNDQATAEAAGNPICPQILTEKALRVAAVVVEQGAVTISSLVDQRPKLGQLAATTGSITRHADLSGLGNDDHLQYILASGTRAFSGDIDAGGNDLTNVVLVDGVDVSSHADRHISGALDEIDGDIVDIDFVPTYYTRDDTDPLAPSVANLTSHLKGLDNLSGNHDSRHILGGGDEVDGDQVDVDFTPTYYTPDSSDPLAPNVDHLTAHLKGLDNLSGNHDARHILGGGDEMDGDQVDIDFTPTYYTPDNADPLAPNVDHLTAHLKGLDNLSGNHDARHINGGADVIDGDKLEITFTPTNYTRTTTVEAPSTSDLTAHLKGIDNSLSVFGQSYTNSESIAAATTTLATYTSAVTISTPATAGTYFIQWSAQVQSNATTQPVLIRIHNTTTNTTTVAETRHTSITNTTYVNISGHFVVTTAGVNAYAVQYAADVAGRTKRIQEARMTLWRVA